VTERVRGNPERLEEYTEETRRTLGPLRLAIDEYAEAVRAFNHASNDLGASLADDSGHYHATVHRLERVDGGPAAFAWALRRLDRFVSGAPAGAVLSTTEVDLFHRLIDARLASPSGSDDMVWAQALDAATETAEGVAAALGRIVDAAQAPDALDSWAISSLRAAVETLRRRNGDVAYLTRLYEALGPERTAALPGAIGLVVSGERSRTGGDGDLDVRATVAAVSETLAAASAHLDRQWRDGLFAAGSRDGILAGGFSLLFSTGRFDPKFAVRAGQLGIDVIDGAVWADPGVDRAKPLYEAIGQLNRHWADGGAALISAAARTPAAANALLRADGNARRVTSDQFGWRQHPDLPVVEAAPWWSIGGPVRELLTSGTVTYARHDLVAARAAATRVVNAAAPDRDPDDGRPWYAAAGHRVQGWVTGAGSEVRDFFAGVAQSTGRVVKGISEQLRQLDDRVAAQLRHARSVLDRISALVGRLAERFIDTVGGLSKSLALLVGALPTPITDAAQVAREVVTGAVDTLKGSLPPAPDSDDGPSGVERARDAAGKLLGRARDVGGKALDRARDAGGKLLDRAADAGGKFLGGARDWVFDKLGAIKDRIVGWLSEKVQAFIARIGPLLERLKEKWEHDIWPAIDRWVDDHVELLRNISTGFQILGGIADVIGLILLFTPLAPFAPIAFAIGRVFGVLSLAVEALLAATGNGSWTDFAIAAGLTFIPFGRIGKPLVKFLKPFIKKIPWARLGRLFGRLAGGARGVVARARRWIEEKLPTIANWTRRFVSRTRKWVEDQVQALANRIRGFVSRTRRWVEDQVQALANRIRGFVSRARKWVEDQVQALANRIRGFVSRTRRWVEEKVRAFSNRIRAAVVALKVFAKLGPRLGKKFIDEIGVQETERLLNVLDAPTLKRLSEKLSPAELKRLLDGLGEDRFKNLAKKLSPAQLKELADALEAVKAGELTHDDLGTVLGKLGRAKNDNQVNEALAELRNARRIIEAGEQAAGEPVHISASRARAKKLGFDIDKINEADALYRGADGNVHVEEVKATANALVDKLRKDPQQIDNLVAWQRLGPGRVAEIVIDTDEGWTDLFGIVRGRPALNHIIESGLPLRIGRRRFTNKQLRELRRAVEEDQVASGVPGMMSYNDYFKSIPTLDHLAARLGRPIP
jgi:uncharacterized protein YoxC